MLKKEDTESRCSGGIVGSYLDLAFLGVNWESPENFEQGSGSEDSSKVGSGEI